jgi:hypothetical protein
MLEVGVIVVLAIICLGTLYGVVVALTSRKR